MADVLAEFTWGVSDDLGAAEAHAAKRVLVDSLAVGLGALRHRAAHAARRYAALFPLPEGARVWGTPAFTSPEVAALVNGAPLRAYDYNDFYSGRVGGGHPSDLVSAVVAIAEWRRASGREMLSALALGYEVAIALFNTVDVSRAGWDYVNNTAIAATCAVGRLLGLSRDQTYEALSIAVSSHAASGELESGDLNARGDLTMWKRFNNGDAMRQAVYACFLASAGIEGPVRAFMGDLGFLKQINATPDTVESLREELHVERPLSKIAQTTFKRWPVGSRGQSAIYAALRARAKVTDPATIERVRVFTDAAAYEHLVEIRANPWAPDSRETADHSLPYIVATAVLDGFVRPESFAKSTVIDASRQAFLRDRVTVERSPELSLGAASGFLTRVEIETRDGRVFVGDPAPPPGHPLNPLSDADLREKLDENVAPLLGAEHVARLADALWSVDGLDDVRALTALFGADGAGIDGEIAE
jgi:2-methylcitrate dehydratase